MVHQDVSVAETIFVRGHALPAETYWVHGGQPYVVCAFYAPDSLPKVLSLKHSLQRLGINFFLKVHDGDGSGHANARLKPRFLEYCLKKFPGKDIVYVDANAVVCKPLTFLENHASDVSLYFRPVMVDGNALLRPSSGTMFIKNSEVGRQFVSLWRKAGENAKPGMVDEDLLHLAFTEMRGISISVLPHSYIKVFDQPKDPAHEHRSSGNGHFLVAHALTWMKRAAVIVSGLATGGLLWSLSQYLA